MNEFCGKRISVIGAARSGVAAASVLTRLGAAVTLADSQPAEALGTARLAEIAATGARFVPGASVEDALPIGTELVVTSPGVPQTAPVLQEALQRGLPVWSEIELAYRLTAAPIVAITGTNGKTTTTLLIAAMLQASGKNALVAGNVSADEIKRTLVDAAYETRLLPPTALAPVPSPAAPGEGRAEAGSLPSLGGKGDGGLGPTQGRRESELLRSPSPAAWIARRRAETLRPDPCSRGEGDEGDRARESDPILVAEISSFQLEWVERFAPKVGVLTNVMPDHLNRHASLEEYARTKARLFAAQGPDDWAILNYDNPAARAIGLSDLPGRRCWFTRAACPPDDGPAAWVQDGLLQVRLESSGKPTAILPASALPPTLPGAHSVENVLAASAAALAMGADAGAIAEAVRGFGGVAHRMELVAEVGGVRYINNSMCTNVAAALASLEALDRPAVVIAGGVNKGLDFAPLAPALRARAKHLLLIGKAAEEMEAVLRAGGYEAISRAATLEEAVFRASQMASPGEAVILSPACASFDMFADFEARGAAFRQAVRALAEGTL
ncbi:MAG TPA: UDP-N-acetylmuramoyl-L-alanine--D-glutamate ligase [Chthonomonadaceae bacterium]|nr:UDP-N-acetylmuramoyl-L-alanine--D-glutamate ligase [Chthonomonadaceae bacterium]